MLRPRAVIVSSCLGNDLAENVFWRRYGYYKSYVASLDDAAPRSRVIGGFALGSSPAVDLDAGWLDSITRAAFPGTGLGDVARRDGGYGIGSWRARPRPTRRNQRDFHGPDRAALAAWLLAGRAATVNAGLLTAMKSRLREAGITFAVLLTDTRGRPGTRRSPRPHRPGSSAASPGEIPVAPGAHSSRGYRLSSWRRISANSLRIEVSRASASALRAVICRCSCSM